MYLLDTNVVSELRKVRLGKADKHVAEWADSVDASDLYLSVVSVQEIEFGVMLAERRDPAQGAMLTIWLERHVLPAFNGRILVIDTTVARRSAQLNIPDPRPERDAMIAASALEHRMTLVTRNTSDFAHMGLHVLDPFAG